MAHVLQFCSAITRKKTFDLGMEHSDLSRCLSLLDLTFLGVGSTLGLGVYVLAGSVAKEQAGPAVVLSFLVAAIASGLAALCYAEFAARVPRAGSAYVYSYVTVGEMVAFIIGWNLMLEYALGGASVARGLVAYVDSQFNHTLENYMTTHLPMNAGFLARYPDPVSFLVLMLVGVLLSVGVRESARLNNVLTFVNITTILIVVGAGIYWIDFGNWSIEKSSIPADVEGGEGGFFPFGVSGMLSGAATCFFGYVGFDAIATTGEEAKNPSRNIPLALITSLFIIFLAYFAISVVLTLMVPYYNQDPETPLLDAFSRVGWSVVVWVVLVGAVFALWTSMVGAMFPLPRLLYAMASDGMIFSFFGYVNATTKTPVAASLVAAFAAGIMAMFFNLTQLIEMLSIGTLQAYTIVAICVLLLRYEDPKEMNQENNNAVIASEPVRSQYCCIRFLDDLINISRRKCPNERSTTVARIAVAILCVLTVGISVMLTNSTSINAISNGYPIAVSVISLMVIAHLLTLLVISRQPVTSVQLMFKVPMLPWFPAISILMNTVLMCKLDRYTWVRFAVWMLLGSINYFFFSICNSVEGKKKTSEISLNSMPGQTAKV